MVDDVMEVLMLVLWDEYVDDDMTMATRLKGQQVCASISDAAR